MKKLILAGVFLLLPPVLAAQQTGQTDLTQVDSTYVPVYDHDFVGGTNEFVRLKLEKGHQYRAELNQSGVQLEINPIDRSVQAPYLARTVPGQSVTGGEIYTLRPYATAIYQIKVLNTTAGAATLRLLEKQPVKKPMQHKKGEEKGEVEDSTR